MANRHEDIIRMGRDSNPRWTRAHSSFQDCRLRPLGHPSKSFTINNLHLKATPCTLPLDALYDALTGTAPAPGVNQTHAQTPLLTPDCRAAGSMGQVYQTVKAEETSPRITVLPTRHGQHAGGGSIGLQRRSR